MAKKHKILAIALVLALIVSSTSPAMAADVNVVTNGQKDMFTVVEFPTYGENGQKNMLVTDVQPDKISVVTNGTVKVINL